jgi:hypothetical protein
VAPSDAKAPSDAVASADAEAPSDAVAPADSDATAAPNVDGSETTAEGGPAVAASAATTAAPAATPVSEGEVEAKPIINAGFGGSGGTGDDAGWITPQNITAVTSSLRAQQPDTPAVVKVRER